MILEKLHNEKSIGEDRWKYPSLPSDRLTVVGKGRPNIVLHMAGIQANSGRMFTLRTVFNKRSHGWNSDGYWRGANEFHDTGPVPSDFFPSVAVHSKSTNKYLVYIAFIFSSHVRKVLTVWIWGYIKNKLFQNKGLVICLKGPAVQQNSGSLIYRRPNSRFVVALHAILEVDQILN